MNIVDYPKHVPPAPAQDSQAYAVIVRPSTGLHYPLENGVAWNGKIWVYWQHKDLVPNGQPFDDTTKRVVSWVDTRKVTPKAVAPTPTPVVAEDLLYTVQLMSFTPASKIGVIRLIREVLALSLADSKVFVESAPHPVKDSLNKTDAQALKQKLEDAGAQTQMLAS